MEERKHYNTIEQTVRLVIENCSQCGHSHVSSVNGYTTVFCGKLKEFVHEGIPDNNIGMSDLIPDKCPLLKEEDRRKEWKPEPNADCGNSGEKQTEDCVECDDTVVILSAASEKGESDLYGDYSFKPNPLEHYSNSNKSKVCRYNDGDGHGYGISHIEVETTIGFIREMGWEDDLKYRKDKR